MEKTGYICFMIILKMLGIKNDQKALEEKFMKIEDTDIAIIRIAKEMGLKVKAARFSERIFNKLTVPVIARCKDGRYILILGIHEDKCKILEPANGNPSTVHVSELKEKIDGSCIVIGKKYHACLMVLFLHKWN